MKTEEFLNTTRTGQVISRLLTIMLRTIGSNQAGAIVPRAEARRDLLSDRRDWKQSARKRSRLERRLSGEAWQ